MINNHVYSVDNGIPMVRMAVISSNSWQYSPHAKYHPAETATFNYTGGPRRPSDITDIHLKRKHQFDSGDFNTVEDAETRHNHPHNGCHVGHVPLTLNEVGIKFDTYQHGITNCSERPSARREVESRPAR